MNPTEKITSTRPENVRATIKLFERVRDTPPNVPEGVCHKSVDLSLFQYNFHSYTSQPTLKTEKKLYECGTTACFAGWIAVSKVFHMDGGVTDMVGAPIYPNEDGFASCTVPETLSRFLGLPETICAALAGLSGLKDTYQIYGNVAAHDVDAQTIINTLEKFL